MSKTTNRRFTFKKKKKLIIIIKNLTGTLCRKKKSSIEMLPGSFPFIVVKVNIFGSGICVGSIVLNSLQFHRIKAGQHFCLIHNGYMNCCHFVAYAASQSGEVEAFTRFHIARLIHSRVKLHDPTSIFPSNIHNKSKVLK